MSTDESSDYDGYFLYNRLGCSEIVTSMAPVRALTMSYPHAPANHSRFTDGQTVESVFDVDTDTEAPYEAQRTVQRYLSQETRHNILQVILGHPAHLVSVSEFDYYIQKSRSTISEQLGDLENHKIVAQYSHEPNSESRDIPADFWSLTAFGIDLIEEYNYLRGLPIMRAVHDATHKTKTVQRHENAPRPPLPKAIADRLEFDETDRGETPNPQDSVADLREQTFYADAAPADPRILNESADGDRTLDELF